MASFRSKLDRLGPPGPGLSPAPAPLTSAAPVEPSIVEDATPVEPAIAEEAAPALPGKVDAAPASQPSPSSPSLESLRDKIAQIMARDRHKPAPHDPARGELPFVRIETPSGPLYQRVLHYVTTHRMGRFSVMDGDNADAAMLALLALDPAIASVDTRNLLYLDTETTGLAGGTGTVPFLIGMARFEDVGEGRVLVLEQLLLRQLGEEGPMLERLLREAERASGFVSYNGKSFDLPLLRTRLVMNRMPALPERPHLDLVHVARRVHQKRLGACKLTQVEQKVLGFVRENDVPSGEVVARYRHFLRTGDDGSLLGVVEHNAWDIVALAALVGIYGAPVVSLEGGDLVGVSKTMRRARALDEAITAASEAVAKGGGALALRERAEVARARGERDRAVADLEQVVAGVDDPEARLALAKLYEHHVKAPASALALVEQGTSEQPEMAGKRETRLRKKVASAPQASLPGVEGTHAVAGKKKRRKASDA